MSWINYLLEANLYLVIFYAAYYLLLRRDTHYQLNRIYLLMCSVVAFLAPFVQIGILRPVPLTTNHTGLNNSYVIAAHPHSTGIPSIVDAQPDVLNYYLLAYITITAILAIGFAIRIYQLYRLSKKGTSTSSIANFKVIEIADDGHAFSFFNCLFIGTNLKGSATVIEHELVHIRQKHSIDIVYLELLKIICWFNPVVYLLQNSMKEVHEYIADNALAGNAQQVNQYTDFLISNAYGLSAHNLTNQFSHKNLLKNRIMMLHQKRSGGLARLKYLVVFPLLTGMLCISTLGFTKNYKLIDLAPGNVHSVSDKPIAKQTDKSRLMVKSKGIVVITDKLSVKQPDGSAKNYTINLNDADKKELAQQDMEVRVISNVKITHINDDAKKKDMTVITDSITVNDTLRKGDFESFYKQIGVHVRYPAKSRNENVQGKVFVVFNVDNDNKISNVWIARGLTDEMNNEVIRVIKNCNVAPGMKPGINYTVPVSFALQDESGKEWADSKPYKREQPFVQNYTKTGFPVVSLNEVVIIGYGTTVK